MGFPGNPVVKNLFCNPGDTSSIPGPGRSRHGATKSESRNYTALAPRAPVLQQEKPLQREGAHHIRQPTGSPYLPQLEKASPRQQRPKAAINE